MTDFIRPLRAELEKVERQLKVLAESEKFPFSSEARADYRLSESKLTIIRVGLMQAIRAYERAEALGRKV